MIAKNGTLWEPSAEYGVQATFPDSRRGGRGPEESDERPSRIRVLGARSDTRREHSNFLNLGWQRPYIIYAGHRQELADLLEADFGVASRDHGADPLAFDS